MKRLLTVLSLGITIALGQKNLVFYVTQQTKGGKKL